MRPALGVVIREEIQDLLDHFSVCFGIRILFYDASGGVLREGLSQGDCAFCLAVRRLYGKSRCLALDEQMRQKALEKRSLLRYQCHAGLVECIYPIFANGQLLGYAMVGQFRERGTLQDQARNDWNSTIGTKELEEHHERLPVVESSMVDHILGLFRLVVDYIVSREMIAVRGSLLVERVIELIDRAIEPSVGRTATVPRVNEVAVAVGRSVSSLSHLLRETAGKSFGRLVRERRVDHAERFLRLHPDARLSEVAEALGFSDQFHFSRVYRSIRGFPPSEFTKFQSPNAEVTVTVRRVPSPGGSTIPPNPPTSSSAKMPKGG